MMKQAKHTHGRRAQGAAIAIACLVAGLFAVLACWSAGASGIGPVAVPVECAYADEAADEGSAPSGEAAGQASSDTSSDKGDAEEGGSDDSESDNLVDPTQRADNSFIYDTTIETLIGEASVNDNRVVQVVGEVIGDRIAADEPGYFWITLTSTDEDSPTTMSVLLTEEQTGQIDHYGRYGVVGTTFQVRGVYHQACQTHQGLPDIHATSAATITRGIEHHDKLRLRRFVPGVALVFVGLVLMGVYYFVREKMR